MGPARAVAARREAGRIAVKCIVIAVAGLEMLSL
jgi:hypothetical protein